MTDSEMMALDSKLVEIFSQRKKEPNKKREQKDAKENVVNFKNRVLDLLEIYVKKQAGNPLAFGLLLPLLQLIRTTKTSQVKTKASNLIDAFAKASKGAKGKGAEFDVNTIFQTLRDIHNEASKDPSSGFTKAASTASLLVVASLCRADSQAIKEVATIYTDSQLKCYKREVKIPRAFFEQWVIWVDSHMNQK
jgi:DNA polymerase phi